MNSHLLWTFPPIRFSCSGILLIFLLSSLKSASLEPKADATLVCLIIKNSSLHNTPLLPFFSGINLNHIWRRQTHHQKRMFWFSDYQKDDNVVTFCLILLPSICLLFLYMLMRSRNPVYDMSFWEYLLHLFYKEREKEKGGLEKTQLFERQSLLCFKGILNEQQTISFVWNKQSLLYCKKETWVCCKRFCFTNLRTDLYSMLNLIFHLRKISLVVFFKNQYIIWES